MKISDKGGLYKDDNIVGISISQWLPCPLAIWNLLFEMAILLNLVKTLLISLLTSFLRSRLSSAAYDRLNVSATYISDPLLYLTSSG